MSDVRFYPVDTKVNRKPQVLLGAHSFGTNCHEIQDFDEVWPSTTIEMHRGYHRSIGKMHEPAWGWPGGFCRSHR